MLRNVLVLAALAGLGYLLDGGLRPDAQLAIAPLLVAGGTALAGWGAKKGLDEATKKKKKKSEGTGHGVGEGDVRSDFYDPKGTSQGPAGASPTGLFNPQAFAPTSSFDWGQQAQNAEYGNAYTSQDIGRARDALDLLGKRARGEVPSIAEQVAQRQLGKGQAAIASQAASVPGGYNPAAMRTAQYATQDLAQRVSGDAAIAGAKERLAAQQAYAQAAAQRAGQQGQLEVARGQLAARYRQLGFAEDQANRAAQQTLMQLLLRKYLGERGIAQQETASARQRDAALGAAGINAAGSALGAIAGVAGA